MKTFVHLPPPPQKEREGGLELIGALSCGTKGLYNCHRCSLPRICSSDFGEPSLCPNQLSQEPSCDQVY